MACCMFAAFIIGHIVLMWRSIEARWLPQRAAARAAALGASAWRPGMAVPAPVQRTNRRLIPKMAGVALIAVSLGYFAVQAKDAFERTSDAKSFALLLAQNICRTAPDATAKLPVRIAANQNRK